MKIKYSLVSNLTIAKKNITIGAGILITLFSCAEVVNASGTFVKCDTYENVITECIPTLHAAVEISLAPNTELTIKDKNVNDTDGGNPQILERFISSILTDMVPLDGDISKFVDDNFWDLI